jgi:hypothetical protein
MNNNRYPLVDWFPWNEENPLQITWPVGAGQPHPAILEMAAAAGARVTNDVTGRIQIDCPTDMIIRLVKIGILTLTGQDQETADE